MLSKLKGLIQKGNQETVVGSLDDLANIQDERVSKVVVGGELVFATLDSTVDPGDDFVLQKPRSTKKFLSVWLLKKLEKQSDKPTQLNFWVHKQVLESIRKGSKNTQWIIAQDYYIKWGLQQKGNVIFVGGLASDHGMNLEVFRFENGRIEEVCEYEYHLDGQDFNSSNVSIDVFSMLSEWRTNYPEHRIVWSDPLPEFSSVFSQLEIEQIGREAFGSGTVWTLIDPDYGQGIDRSYKPYAVLGGVVVASVLIYGAMLFWGNRSYTSAVEIYEAEIAGIRDRYEQGNQSLEKLEDQRRFLEKETGYADTMAEMVGSVNVISSMPGAILERITYLMDENYSHKTLEENEDFYFIVKAPALAGKNALEQAKPMLVKMSGQMGANLYVKRYATKDQKVYGRSTAYRSYEIHGRHFISGAE